jgi:DNA-binding NtrC family response regulator
VVPIPDPPLRERAEDTPARANHFLAHYWSRHRESTAQLPRLSHAAIRALVSRPWRGNVRELQNVIEHTVVLIEPGGEIQPRDIPNIGDEHQAQEIPVAAPPVPESAIEASYHTARERLLAQFERHYLEQLVVLAEGNMSRAARIAGVDRTTLYRLMERQGLHRKLLVTPVEDDRTPSEEPSKA